MKKLLFALFIFMLVCASCACILRVSEEDIPKSTVTFNVLIDKNFTQQHKVQVFQALEDWRVETGDKLKFNMQIVDYFELDNEHKKENTISIYSKDPGIGYIGWASWMTSNNSAYIYMRPGLSDDIFNATALHELGHALHLQHYTGNNNAIMHPSVYPGEKLACEDIHDFCDEWGCTKDCDPTVKTEGTKIQAIIAEPHMDSCGLK